MIYLNLQTEFLRAPAYIGSEPVQRATWLNLMLYVAERELGGEIEGCGSWSCRQWQQTCGITKDEVQSVCGLWSFDEETLILWEYPVNQEVAMHAKRKGGRKGGLSKPLSPSQGKLEGKLEANLERKGKGKGKGNEKGNGKTTLSKPAVSTPARDFFDWYCEMAKDNGLPIPRKLTEDWIKITRTRLREGIADDLPALRKAIEESPHLLGDNDRGWRMTFEFLIRNGTNVEKIFAGSYQKAQPAQLDSGF